MIVNTLLCRNTLESQRICNQTRLHEHQVSEDLDLALCDLHKPRKG